MTKSLAEYPQVYTFKILTGLIGLQEGVVDEQTFMSHHGFKLCKRTIYEIWVLDRTMNNGTSCNTYFANV
jgi:penicillin-binding protein 2